MTAHNHNQNEAEFDNLLDQALVEYRDAEPLAGLEDRVLQRLGTNRKSRRVAWFRWSLAVCAAVVVAVVWLQPAHPPEPQNTASQHEAAATIQTAPATSSSSAKLSASNANTPHTQAPPASTRVATAVASLSHGANPRMSEQFPARVPLTAEEQALVAVLARRNAPQPTEADSDEPATIAAIEIKPLVQTTTDSGEN